MLCTFTTFLLQQKLRKLAIYGVFTVDFLQILTLLFADFIISQHLWIKKTVFKNSDDNIVKILLYFFFKFFV